MTTSLELSKQLFEKRLLIETEKAHRGYKYENGHQEWWVLDKDIVAENPNYDEFPAPSTDELLAVMPYKISNIYYLVICKAFSDYIIRYFDYEKSEKSKIINKSLPEALGQMCIWLLNNGYQFNGKELAIQ